MNCRFVGRDRLAIGLGQLLLAFLSLLLGEVDSGLTRFRGSLAGLFRQYEIFYVVATERDLIGVRTNHRRPPEDVYVYRTDAKPAGARRLFTDYLRTMNELVKNPEFYNTLTTNCTTVIVMHVDATSGAIPGSWKVLVSGLFPEYLYELGYLDESVPFRELKQRSHVNARAKAADGAEDFSARIRIGQPVPTR